MPKDTKKRAVIALLIFFCLIVVSIAISYIPALSHLEMIFKILPQTILYLFFGFAITYTQSHYNNKEASNGAKYVNITYPFLKRVLIPKERTKDTDGYIKVENRSKITISSLLLYFNCFIIWLLSLQEQSQQVILQGLKLFYITIAFAIFYF